MLTSYDEAVAGWAAHLRSGGTTTWSVWLDRDPAPRRPQRPRPLPDAVHLELVRRLNEAAGEPVEALADRVLATASPGRGLVDVPLPWPEGVRGYGSPATDPARLPEEELIRLAVGVLVHLLPGVPRRARRTPPPAGRSRGGAASCCTDPPARPPPYDAGSSRQGLRRDRLATHARRARAAGRGDDGRAVGCPHVARRQPEVDDAVASPGGGAPPPPTDRRRRDRPTASPDVDANRSTWWSLATPRKPRRRPPDSSAPARSSRPAPETSPTPTCCAG